MPYIIDKNTILVIKSNNNTIIYDNKEKHVIKRKIKDVLNDCCKYYGSSLKGRIEGTNYLLGSIYKAPIIISEYQEIIMFPTSSFKCDDCMWINYAWIEKYFCDDNKTFIIFKNGLKIEINISTKIINNQILRSSRLESILKSKNR